MSPEEAHREVDVLTHIIDPTSAANIPARLLGLFDTTKLKSSPSSRLCVGETTPHVVRYLLLDMVAQFGVELGLELVPLA